MSYHTHQAGRGNRPLKPSPSDHPLGTAASRQSLRPPKRYKIDRACDLCRRRKIKCDGMRPVCGSCQKKGELRDACHYRQGSNDENMQVTTSADQSSSYAHALETTHQDRSRLASELFSTPFAEDAPISTASAGSDVSPVYPTPQTAGTSVDRLDNYGGSNVRAFTERLKAAVDAKSGVPPGERSIPVPMSDAPLFPGSIGDVGPTDASSQADLVLPPRKHADQLVEIYWSHLHPLNPFLEQKRFKRSYEALFSGTLTDAKERIFLSSLNIILALSTQCQEKIPPIQRQQASLTYFNRACGLLPPAQGIWTSPSLELVEYLLLMSTYLQCTSNPHQTWMAVGSAVRIAQSLELHLPDRFSNDDTHSKQRRRRLWHSCVFMDRQVSMGLGRPTAIHEGFLQAVEPRPNSQSDNTVADDDTAAVDFLVKTLELYTTSYQVCHVPNVPEARRHRSADTAPSRERDDDEDYVQSALRLDAYVDSWQLSLPEPLKHGLSLESGGRTVRRLAVFCRLRLAHSRIILFRPMLAQFCLSQHPVPSDTSSSQGLRQRLIHDCACICICNAQDMISTLQGNSRLGTPSGDPLPWWIRLYYLHVAATVLIAATLRSDMSAQFSIPEWWDRLILALHAHEHLSAVIPQYIDAFKTLSFEVLQTRREGLAGYPIQVESGDSAFQDHLREDSYSTNVLFGLEDIFHLNKF